MDSEPYYAPSDDILAVTDKQVDNINHLDLDKDFQSSPMKSEESKSAEKTREAQLEALRQKSVKAKQEEERIKR